MKCYCRGGSQDCPPSGQKECPQDVKHCLLVLKWNAAIDGYTELIQDCWHWGEAIQCPSISGPCHIVDSHTSNYHSAKPCCCMGELCNNATTIDVILPRGPDVASNFTSTPSKADVDIPSNRFDLNTTLWITIPLLLFLIIALCLLISRHRLLFRVFQSKKISYFNQSKPKTLSEAIISPHGFGSNPCNCSCGHVHLLDDHAANNLCGFATVQHKLAAVGSGWLTAEEVENIASRVTKVELKSQGCFGQVWYGQFSPSDSAAKTDVAIKIFRSAQQESWDTEVSLFRVAGLAHPNILKYYGTDQVSTGALDYDLWIVTEYHPFGSLHDYLKSNTIDWTRLLSIAVSIACGLSHLHAEVLMNRTGLGDGCQKPSIAHRDLNSRNVLLKSDFSACIADFGLTIRFEPGQFLSNAHPQLGTRRYMAPEVLDGAIHFSRDAYLRIDVYAMGLVFWELMSRCSGTDDLPIQPVSPYQAPYELELGPHPAIEHLQLYVVIEKRRPKFNPHWNDFACMCTLSETIEECWDQDAEARLSAGCVMERLIALTRRPWCVVGNHVNNTLNVNSISLFPHPTYNVF